MKKYYNNNKLNYIKKTPIMVIQKRREEIYKIKEENKKFYKWYAEYTKDKPKCVAIPISSTIHIYNKLYKKNISKKNLINIGT